MSNNAHELSNRLLNALDNNYNVVDMQAVNEIISVLEKFNITKELLETTRLGKHVNELRRKTTDPTLARRAKVLVKRWRDLVIPTVTSPGHTGSNRSSAERQVRRLGGTPLTSPALSRVVSPAVNSPRPPSRPTWGGYESDSQDVILVDDDPPPAAPPPPVPPSLLPNSLKPLTPPVKRPTSPVALHDEKKAKRDKKPKKRRGHSRAGSGTETPAVTSPAPPTPLPAPAPAPPASGPAPAPASPAPNAAWGARNGSSERRRNGYRRDKLDPYAALVNKIPVAGAKKVKTTQELLEEIQSRGSKPATSPSSPRSPASPDVMLIEPDSFPVKVESPLRNGGAACPPAPAQSPQPPQSPRVPLEDEREYAACTCAAEPEPGCPAASTSLVRPHHVTALHHTLLPGINGTRAPLFPHKFAVRPAEDPQREGLFASVVPLYKYSDYADDYCAKNMWRVPLCQHLPRDAFAPAPPDLPPPPVPPEPRPYPIDPDPDPDSALESAPASPGATAAQASSPASLLAPVSPPGPAAAALEPSERLKAPLLDAEDERQFGPGAEPDLRAQKQFASELCDHRTVERTKDPPVDDSRSPESLDGRALFAQCASARARVPYDYAQLQAAPELSLPVGVENEADAELQIEQALESAEAETERDSLGRVSRPRRFAEWHECARLGDLVALPYVVID